MMQPETEYKQRNTRSRKLGILSPGHRLEGLLAIKKIIKCTGDNCQIFMLIPEVALGAKERISRQIKRIKKYRAGALPASRLDDNAEIQRNIENLEL